MGVKTHTAPLLSGLWYSHTSYLKETLQISVFEQIGEKDVLSFLDEAVKRFHRGSLERETQKVTRGDNRPSSCSLGQPYNLRLDHDALYPNGVIEDMGLRREIQRLREAKNVPDGCRLVPIANIPKKSIALPMAYLDSLLEEHGTCAEHLVPGDPILAIFIQEGLVLAFFFLNPGEPLQRFVFHPMMFGDLESSEVKAAGKEVYDLWVSIPKNMLLSWDHLDKNARSMFRMERS